MGSTSVGVTCTTNHLLLVRRSDRFVPTRWGHAHMPYTSPGYRLLLLEEEKEKGKEEEEEDKRDE